LGSVSLESSIEEQINLKGEVDRHALGAHGISAYHHHCDFVFIQLQVVQLYFGGEDASGLESGVCRFGVYGENQLVCEVTHKEIAYLI
jgi:hypothetical protein